MAQRIEIYINNRGLGRNELKMKREGMYDLLIGKEGFDPKSRGDQFWLIDELRSSGQEISNERTLQYEIGKINGENLSGRVSLRVE